MIEKGMNFSDRCRFCHELGEKIEPFLCESCKQKIFDWLNEKGWTIITSNKMNEEKIKKTWKNHTYVQIDPDGQYKRMTEIGFLQAIQELGVKVEE